MLDKIRQPLLGMDLAASLIMWSASLTRAAGLYRRGASPGE
jgi:hypothetical protein